MWLASRGGVGGRVGRFSRRVGADTEDAMAAPRQPWGGNLDSSRGGQGGGVVDSYGHWDK